MNPLTNRDFDNALDLSRPEQEARQLITIRLVRYGQQATEEEEELPTAVVEDTISIDVPVHVWYMHKRFQDIQPGPEVIHWDKCVVLWSSDVFPVRTARGNAKEKILR